MVNYERELEKKASRTIHRLMTAIQRGDAEKYHSLLSAFDKSVMDVDKIRQGIIGMKEQWGSLNSFAVQGVVLHKAAYYAAVYITMDFGIKGRASELYHLILEDSDWKLVVVPPEVN